MNFKYLSKYLAPSIIIILCIGVVLPLLKLGFYPMHDDEQVARLFDLNAALSMGHFPPRIVPNLGFGYGYPFFNFYPPFAYYLAEVFHVLGFGYILSIKMMVFSVFIVSALGMYLFSRLFLNKPGSVVASIAYVYSSYMAVDAYVRGAFAEFNAFMFLPFLFWSTYVLAKKEKIIYIPLIAFFISGLILSHNLIALLFFPFLFIWYIYCVFLTKNKLLFSVRWLSSFALGFGLSAYFWLPSYLEREYTLINILTSELANYSLHFVCTTQLWSSPWGYGGSILGCYDGISFEIGKVQIICSVISVSLAVYYLLKKKKYKIVTPIILFFIFLIICVFMMTKFSKFIWDTFSVLWYTQFPWRLLLLASFFSSFLTGGILIFIRNLKIQVIISFLVISLLIIFSYGRFSPERYINVKDDYYVNSEKIRWETSSLAYEYVPRGIKTVKSDIGTTKIDISKNEISKSSFEIIKGEVKIEEVENKPHFKKYIVDVLTPVVFQINTFSFPGWELKIDGKKINFSDNNKLKLIRASIGKGKHEVVVEFKDTPTRHIGNIVSIISIIITIAIVFYTIKNKYEKT